MAEFTARPSGSCLALGYADDVLLRTPAAEAAVALDAWAALLLPLGLSLNVAKTGVWNPAKHLPLPAWAHDLWPSAGARRPRDC